MVKNKTPRSRMSQADRAKQFMPFAALKGLPEALAKKEKILVPKMELSEDYREELDRLFQQIHHKDIVTIVYFQDTEHHSPTHFEEGNRLSSYTKITGMVSKIDTSAGYIPVVHTKIAFHDIVEIILQDSVK